MSESDDKPLKWRKKNSPSTEFKGVLGKIINKVKENKDKKAEKDARTVDEGESLKAVKELFKGVKEKNEEINKHNQKLVVKDDSKNSVIKEETPISNASVLTPKVENKTSVLKEEKKAGNAEESLKNISVKDDFTKTYPLGSAVAKGQKPPCICPDKSKNFESISFVASIFILFTRQFIIYDIIDILYKCFYYKCSNYSFYFSFYLFLSFY